MGNSISYTITKTAENTYSMTWTLNEDPITTTTVVQRKTLKLIKEDSDGTKNVESFDIRPTSIATYPSGYESCPDGTKIDGFITGINLDNLAVGGVCYEIEDVVSSN